MDKAFVGTFATGGALLLAFVGLYVFGRVTQRRWALAGAIVALCLSAIFFYAASNLVHNVLMRRAVDVAYGATVGVALPCVMLDLLFRFF